MKNHYASEAQNKIIKAIESVEAKNKLDEFKKSKQPKKKKRAQKRKVKIKTEPGQDHPKRNQDHPKRNQKKTLHNMSNFKIPTYVRFFQKPYICM